LAAWRRRPSPVGSRPGAVPRCPVPTSRRRVGSDGPSPAGSRPGGDGAASHRPVPTSRRRAVRGRRGIVGQPLPDRGQAATLRLSVAIATNVATVPTSRRRGVPSGHTAMGHLPDRGQPRPVPASRRRGVPSRGRRRPSPAGSGPNGLRHIAPVPTSRRWSVPLRGPSPAGSLPSDDGPALAIPGPVAPCPRRDAGALHLWPSPAGSRPGGDPHARVATPGRSVAVGSDGHPLPDRGRHQHRPVPTSRCRGVLLGSDPRGHHLPDRGRAATPRLVAMVVVRRRPVPTSRRRGGPSGVAAPAGSRPGG
jgi:hypothetical protein